MRAPRSTARRILICRTDNIGDVVLTLPLAGWLKQQLPGVQVDFLVRSYAAPVARLSRFIDQVHCIDDFPRAEQLFAHHAYDTVVFAYPNRRLAQAAWRARVPERIGTSHRLYHWLRCNRLVHFSRVKSTLHEAQLNFALLRPLGLTHTPTPAEIVPLYGLAAPALARAEALAAQAPFNLIIHPKSNGNGREWPLAHYTALAQQLADDGGIRLWVTGSGSEGTLLAQAAPDLLALPNVVNLCGQFDLGELAALIGAADGLVASGTGPMHLAAALGRPTLGLFPPIKPIDAGRWGALGAQAQSMTAPQRCASCADKDSCRCMEAISPAQVAQVVRAWRAAQVSRACA
ncbi:glycosyltransferase family 9 protein [Massilia sp. CF038]|uniref:glycosyltransferase family 9 protein n=1 Tax=Massilia sp. CF038 TaxID=1881045 RepID=UPI000917CB9B|nr:glycosyltransferase family 9 protein [Massilia sp. CF038]SHG39900.1 ADP-heptose:LPS heptosyltransferase [Massilia sp. CF038]